MAAEPLYVPTPVCEVCWLIEHTIWEPESVDENGKVLMRLIGVDVPEKVNTDSVDVCSACGAITVAGIYELRDPKDFDEYAVDYSSEVYDPMSFTIELGTSEDEKEED